MSERSVIDRFLALLLAQAAPRYYKTVEDGYLVGIGVGAGGAEITREEYGRIEAVIAAKPTPPEGCDYLLREDLQWQSVALPESGEAEDAPLDPAEALELICGKRVLTRTEAVRYRTELKSAATAREEPSVPEIKEKQEG